MFDSADQGTGTFGLGRSRPLPRAAAAFDYARQGLQLARETPPRARPAASSAGSFALLAACSLVLTVVGMVPALVPAFRFDTADFPGRVQLHAELDDGEWIGYLCRDGERLGLADVRAVFLRRPRPFEVPAHLTVAERWHAATECRYGLGGVLMSLPVPYVNHPSRSADAAYKPRQLRDLRACGLLTPPTLITNSSDAVRRFANRHGTLVCKASAATALHTGTTAHVAYTRKVTDLDDLDGVDYAAHLFQPFIESEYAVRLTVIGQRFLAVRINAGSERAAVDWRSDYDSLSYEVIELPPSIVTGVSAYMKMSGLHYGAWDFLVQRDGTHVALEINPEGNYSWIEEETSLPISASIASFLTGEDHP
jgi:glutathione synthase/RimK-type ligase-like ATP-grasp enzyme